jgi:hypothetical protein
MGLQQPLCGPRQIRRGQVAAPAAFAIIPRPAALAGDNLAQITARPRSPQAGGFFFLAFPRFRHRRRASEDSREKMTAAACHVSAPKAQKAIAQPNGLGSHPQISQL